MHSTEPIDTGLTQVILVSISQLSASAVQFISAMF